MQITKKMKYGFMTIIAGLLALSPQSARTAEVAPYFYAWGEGNIQSLVQAKRLAALSHATLAFVISDGTCRMDKSVDYMLTDIKNYLASGGKLIISFGGAYGTYIETACTDENQLFAEIDAIIQKTGVRKLDFDVEGPQLDNKAATARRTRVLARLQTKYPDLYLSFTVGASGYGIFPGAMDLIKTTVSGSVRINIVNLMTMDYYDGATANIGTMAIRSADAAVNQLRSIYPNKTTAQLYGMIGITPMIGQNDDGLFFTLSDATQVANYAKQNGIGHLAFWAFQRDVAQTQKGTNDLDKFSGVVQSDFQFLNIFRTAEGPVVAPTPAPGPAPQPTPSSVCNYPNWVEGKSYLKGDIVKFTDGKLYIAEYDNPGYWPTVSTWYWDPYTCSSTVPTPTPTPTPAPSPAPTPTPAPVVKCSFPNWVEGKRYVKGDIVKFLNGQLYIAEHDNPGYWPTASTWYWDPFTCK